MVLLPMITEFDEALSEISELVAEMESRHPLFPEHCNQFLLRLEKMAQRYSLPIASELAVLRGETLCKKAGKKGDRKEARRQRDETLMSALSQAKSIAEQYFSPWRKIFEECGALCRQMTAGAALKGLALGDPRASNALDTAWHSLLNDPEMAPVLAHVVGHAGLPNARILLDQSLSYSDEYTKKQLIPEKGT